MNEYFEVVKDIIHTKISNEELDKSWLTSEDNLSELIYSDIKTDDRLQDSTVVINDAELEKNVKEIWNNFFSKGKAPVHAEPKLKRATTVKRAPIISKISVSNFIVKKTILSYIVKDYDILCHSIQASQRFPFIKLTSRKGETFYKVFKNFKIPEEWFAEDEDIDFYIKFQTSLKQKKDVNDMFAMFYIKKVDAENGKSVIIIEKDDNPKHAPYFKEIMEYTSGDAVSETFTGEVFISNSLFTSENSIYFTDYIFFHSKHFEFDESQNTVGAKKERYYLKKKGTSIRLSFTKIYDDVFTMSISNVKKGSEKAIIDALIDDFKNWHKILPDIKDEYDQLMNEAGVGRTATGGVDSGVGGKKAPLKNQNKRLDIIKNEYKKAGKTLPHGYARKCMKKVQPYILTDENREIYEEAIKDKSLKLVPDVPSRIEHDGFEWACVPRRDNEGATYYPYIKKGDAPCCSITPQVEKTTVGVHKTTTYIKTTTNKDVMYSERGHLPPWWERINRLTSSSGGDVKTYLRYSLGKGTDINNNILLRCVLYATDKDFPTRVSENEVDEYISENYSDYPDVITYNEHIADLTALGGINIVVFKDENVFFNEATPAFNKKLKTIVLFESPSLNKSDIFPSYDIIVEEFDPIFTPRDNEKLYDFFQKLYDSYKTYYIVSNNYSL
jgi:hypothetical protein